MSIDKKLYEENIISILESSTEWIECIDKQLISANEFKSIAEQIILISEHDITDNTSEANLNIPDVSHLLPTLEEVKKEVNKIQGRATENGWRYKRQGFQHGINWALNYINKKAIDSNNG